MNAVKNSPCVVSCPTHEELVAFNSGKLPTSALEAISDHLASCVRCLVALGGLAEEEEAALLAFRRSLQDSTPDPFADDPEYRRMRDGASQLFTHEPAWLPWLDVPIPELTLPFVLGQYQVLEKIGQGAMGTVYRALHTRLKKGVAIKILYANRMAEVRAVARFQREMEAIGRLDHKNIVRATDAGEANGVHFLVMELIDGINLSHLVRLCGPLPVPDACELMRQMALGLQFIHQQGLVHRDIKPSNLLLSVNGEVKILDLGLALLGRDPQSSGELTLSGQVMGTADYMAPEQWEASHEVDIRADLYSLGCTLYTLLTGHPPFDDPIYNSVMKKMAAHAHITAPSVAVRRSETPSGLPAIVERMLRKDPAERYQEPDEVAHALEPFCGGADLAGLMREALWRQAAGVGKASELPTAVAPHCHTGTSRRNGSTATKLCSSTWFGRRSVLTLVAVAALVLVGAVVMAFDLAGLWGRGAGRPKDFQPDRDVNDRPTASARKFKLKEWNNLLDATPGQFYWWNPASASFWNYESKEERVRVHTDHTALISFGRTDAPGYILQIGFRQVPWTGGVGLFFGGQWAPSGTKVTYQRIELRRGPFQNLHSFLLHRGRSGVEVPPDLEPTLIDHGVASWELPGPLEGAEQILEIVVSRRGLVSVKFNGIVCPDLVDGPAGKIDADYQGEFGLFCSKCSAQVTHARFKPTE